MFLIVTPSEDGARLSFFETLGELQEDFQEDFESGSVRFLSPDEAKEDSNYWGEGAVFVASVTPLEAVPHEKIVTWKFQEM